MPRSAIRPDEFWVRRKDVEDDVLVLTIRVRWDIKLIGIPGNDMVSKTRSEWDFKEQEVRAQVDIDDIDASKDPDVQIMALVQSRRGALLSKAQKKWAIETGDYAIKWHRKAVDAVKAT